jgi:hypothetical protein
VERPALPDCLRRFSVRPPGHAAQRQAVLDGSGLAGLAGLMSDHSADQVADQLGALGAAAAQRLGSTVKQPFMQLSFIGLSVIAELRLTDGGLVDVGRFAYVPFEAP